MFETMVSFPTHDMMSPETRRSWVALVSKLRLIMDREYQKARSVG